MQEDPEDIELSDDQVERLRTVPTPADLEDTHGAGVAPRELEEEALRRALEGDART